MWPHRGARASASCKSGCGVWRIAGCRIQPWQPPPSGCSVKLPAPSNGRAADHTPPEPHAWGCGPALDGGRVDGVGETGVCRRRAGPPSALADGRRHRPQAHAIGPLALRGHAHSRQARHRPARAATLEWQVRWRGPPPPHPCTAPQHTAMQRRRRTGLNSQQPPKRNHVCNQHTSTTTTPHPGQHT